MLAPICLFTYNRLEETQQTVEALQKNNLASESCLYVFSDGPKNDIDHSKVEEVRKYIRNINGFKSVDIIESFVNKGLANSIIDGVTQIINEHGKIIVLEDDLVTSPIFLDYMNNALDFYFHENEIQSINGYSLKLKSNKESVYFQTRPFPWGWATWSDRWNNDLFDKQRIKSIINSEKKTLKQFQKSCGNDISTMLIDSLEGRNNSWYVRWVFDHFFNRKYSVFPGYSYVENIGHTTNGTHCKGINPYLASTNTDFKIIDNLPNYKRPGPLITKEFLYYFTFWNKFFVRIKLIPSKNGRTLLIEDFKNKIGL